MRAGCTLGYCRECESHNATEEEEYGNDHMAPTPPEGEPWEVEVEARDRAPSGTAGRRDRATGMTGSADDRLVQSDPPSAAFGPRLWGKVFRDVGDTGTEVSLGAAASLTHAGAWVPSDERDALGPNCRIRAANAQRLRVANGSRCVLLNCKMMSPLLFLIYNGQLVHPYIVFLCVRFYTF
jgi:hypothetical protein